MTKQEFVDKIAERANLGRRDAQNAVDAMLDTDHGDAEGRRRDHLHRLRQVLDAAPRGAHGGQPAESDGEGDDPGFDRAEVLGRERS